LSYNLYLFIGYTITILYMYRKSYDQNRIISILISSNIMISIC
jgi:hypothetical protein